MPNLETEFMSTMMVNESGLPSVIDMQEDGTSIIKTIDPTGETLGPGAYRDPYAMAQSVGEDLSEEQVMGTMGGVVPGVVGGMVTGPQDLAALIYGGGKALTAEEGEGIQKFLEGFSTISGVIGSEALFGLYEQGVDALPISEEAKQGLKQGAIIGDILGAATATPKVAKAGARAAGDYAAGAPARLEEAKSGVTLGMGVDPTQMVDEAIVGAQKAFTKPTKENPVTAVPPTETEPGIIAFHGSGADFDQFSLEKIGTGEGAQAYGYGLYFTDSEDIAKFYRQTVGGGTGIVDFSIGDLDLVRNGEFRDYSPGATPFGRDRRYRRVQDLTAKDYAQAKMIEDIFIKEGRLYNEIRKPGAGVIYEPKQGDELKDELIDIVYETLNGIDPTDQPGEVEYIQNFVNSVAKGDAAIKLDAKQYGKTYKVGLAPKPDELLDYDKPITEQSKKVQDALFSNDEIANIIQRKQEDDGLVPEFYTGMELYEDLAENLLSEQAASMELSEAGILGLKYRAAGSRSAAMADDAAERNYVIFDDKAIKVLEKYGIVGPVAVTALGATKQESAENGDT